MICLLFNKIKEKFDMPRPPRLEKENAFYYITVKGNKNETIFHEDKDYQRFLSQLDRTIQSYQVILYAYVLMKNHYHLLIKTPKANLSKFMQRLNTSYSLYHRHKKGKPGHCFQGRFGAKIIQDDLYLKILSGYIHLNPVKIKSLKKLSTEEKMTYLKEFKWSSFPGYISKKSEESFVCYDILKTFSIDEETARMLYESFILDSISKENEKGQAGGITKLMKKNPFAIGDDNFIVLIEKEIKIQRQGGYGYNDLILPKKKKLEIEFIEQKICETFNIRKEDLRRNVAISGKSKDIAIELSVRYTDLSMRKVGNYYGMRSASGVGGVRKRFIDRNYEQTDEFKNLNISLEQEIEKIND